MAGARLTHRPETDAGKIHLLTADCRARHPDKTVPCAPHATNCVAPNDRTPIASAWVGVPESPHRSGDKTALKRQGFAGIVVPDDQEPALTAHSQCWHVVFQLRRTDCCKQQNVASY